VQFSLQQIPEQRPLLSQPTWWLVGAVAIAWGGVLFGSFQYDDFANVLNDPATTNFDALLDRLFGGIRPLTRLSYAISAALFGEWAGGWLMVQWCIHLVATLLLLRLIELRTNSRRAAFIAAACFALLPSHGATVAYVTGRSIELSTAWLLAALVAHEYAFKRSHRRGWFRALAALCFLAACATRETALVFPLLALLWERTRERAPSWRSCFAQTRTYLIAAAFIAVVAVTSISRYEELLQFSLDHRSPIDSLTRNLFALPATLSLLACPWQLSIEHTAAFDLHQIVLGACCILLMITLAIRVRAKHAWLSIALVWPLIALLPTHSVVAKLDSITEGPLYLACLGPCMAFGIYAERWLARASANVAVPAMLSVAAAAIVLCVWRTIVWSNPTQLWSEATLQTPASARAWTNLGMAQLNDGDYEAARLSFHKSLELDSTDARVMLNLELIAAIHP
jgi:protein O-mannosyl-transferase